MGPEVPVRPSRSACTFVALALPALAAACPSLEDPTPPFEFALLQGFAALFSFGVVQDLRRRLASAPAGGCRLDPWLHVHFLYLGLLVALLSTILATSPPGASGYGPGVDLGLAFTASAGLALWGTLLMGIPIGLFRVGVCRAAAPPAAGDSQALVLRVKKS